MSITNYNMRAYPGHTYRYYVKKAFFEFGHGRPLFVVVARASMDG